MNKMFVDVTVRLEIEAKEGVEWPDVVEELEYSFTTQMKEARIVSQKFKDATSKESK